MDELYPAHAKALKKCKPGAGHLPHSAKFSTTNKWTRLSITQNEWRATKTWELYNSV
jgi:hypothetical protein